MKRLLPGIVLVVCSAPIFAQYAVYQVNGVALSGYDAIDYFLQNKAVEGKDDFTFSWNGVRWKFSSQENLERFKQQPEQYAPQYGGYCAYGASRGYLARTDPQAFTIVDNKLYLNYNLDVRKQWMKDAKVRIKKADENWKSTLKYPAK